MIKLDDRDIAILKALAAEGRMTKAELASRINLSPTPCWERLRKLESAGIIQGYHADISLKQLGGGLVAFVTVELSGHNAESFKTFERIVNQEPEITGCWALGGGFDYLLQVTTRNIETYQALVDAMLDNGAGIARYFTYVVTKPVKQSRMPPIDLLLGK